MFEKMSPTLLLKSRQSQEKEKNNSLLLPTKGYVRV